MEAEPVESILQLIDELRSEDQATKLHAIDNLEKVASAIGDYRTREELVPYMGEMLEDDNDEVLLALANKLGDLAQWVGGQRHLACLLPWLQILASNEEEVIRDKAVTSIGKVAALLPMEAHASEMIPLIRTLAGSDYSSARISACALFTGSYGKLTPEQQGDLLKLFLELAHDDTPMVRRAAATHLGTFTDTVSSSNDQEELFKLFDFLVKDEHDSVRQMTFDSAVQLLKLRPTQLNVIKSCASDRSWRVRYTVAENMDRICEAVVSSEELVPGFLSWLSDAESEVRSIAVMKLPVLISKLPEAITLSQVIPALEPLTKDASPHVKFALMQSICKIAASLGADNTILKLLPLVNQLLKDEAYEVRLAFAESMHDFNKNFSPDKLSAVILPLPIGLMNDVQWRVRLKVVEYLPKLAGLLGVDVFREKLAEPLMKWAEDPVFAVREAVLEVLAQLATNFGSQWISELAMPFIRRLSEHAIFAKRMTALVALTKLHKVLNPQDMLDVLVRMTKDPVPNIKFNVAKALKLVGAQCSAGTRQLHFLPLLQKLKVDSDFDVRFFAEEAMRELDIS